MVPKMVVAFLMAAATVSALGAEPMGRLGLASLTRIADEFVLLYASEIKWK